MGIFSQCLQALHTVFPITLKKSEMFAKPESCTYICIYN